MLTNTQIEFKTLLSETEFRQLAEVHDQDCISIYIPLQFSGTADLLSKSAILLKNQLKEVTQKLMDRGMGKDEAQSYLNPIFSLSEDLDFWKNQSQGLCIFYHHQSLNCYMLPHQFSGGNYVGDHFYLLPTMPLFYGNGEYYLLNLALQEVKLYAGNRNTLTEVALEDALPSQLEDVVGYDYEPKSLQFRSGQGGDAGANFHGHGAGSEEERKIELRKFFRAVDKQLMEYLSPENPPLLLACVDYYYPIYKEISNYATLYPDHLSGSLGDETPAVLHEKSWELIGDHFQKQQRDQIKRYGELTPAGKTSTRLEEVIPAALERRIETLFIQKNSDIKGLYDAINQAVLLDSLPEIDQSSLYNLAAVQTKMQGGQVYLLEADEMPVDGTTIAAILRY